MRSLASLAAPLCGLLLLAGCGPKAPAWTHGASDLYPPEAFLTGVGTAAERNVAEDRARSAIAKVFAVEIRATETSSESFWLSRAGASGGSEYRQSAQAELSATTDRVLSGVRIAEVWRQGEKGDHYALAVLDRRQAARPLHSALAELDQGAVEAVRLAEETESPVRKLAYYMRALDSLAQRRAVASDLRILAAGGHVAAAPYATAEIAARADRVAGTIHIGVELEGDREGIVRGALIGALAGIGMRLAPVYEQDLVLRGRVTVEEYRTEDPWRWSVAAAQVEFAEADGAVIDSARLTVREGARIAERSRTQALERLGGDLAVVLVEKIGTLGIDRR